VKNSIGVMQGRLLPKYKGRYQAHPVNYWQDEFLIAKDAGLDCIEFIFDFNDINKNPLIKEGALTEIQQISDISGIKIHSICADYFMEFPLHSEDSNVAITSQELLLKLINNASKLSVKDIVIPCVDQSSLAGKAVDRFVEILTPIMKIAENHKINISLETDLAPKPFLDLLNRFDSDHLTVNYDIGNSASLGYDCIEELDYYGDRITDIHIKDRLLNGGPVILGKGNANFDIFFDKLKEFDYSGPFIMQAYRDEQGITIFKQQLEWILPYFDE
jgi:L-ribulose-5-phosphate 3-epimerase